MAFRRMYSGMAERIVHCLPGDIELSGLKIRGMRFEVFYTATGECAAGGGESREEAVVWGGLVWVGVGEVVVERVGGMGRRANNIFGRICHGRARGGQQ